MRASIQERFAEKIAREMRNQVAHAGDWIVEYENERYKVYFYGNFRGWFDTANGVLEEIPNWCRESIRKQLARTHQANLGI